VSETLNNKDLISIVTDPKVFEKLASLLKRWKDNHKIVGLVGQLVEESENGAEDLLKANHYTLDILSRILLEEQASTGVFQDGVKMLGNLLFYGEKNTRKSILEKTADNNVLATVLKSLPELKEVITDDQSLAH